MMPRQQKYPRATRTLTEIDREGLTLVPYHVPG